MNIFIMVTLSLDYHILLPSNKSIMSMPPITLGGLGIIEIGALMNISDKDLTDLAYSGLTPHLKEKLESHVFFNVSQLLHQNLDCKS
jgi:hypothetical protein